MVKDHAEDETQQKCQNEDGNCVYRIRETLGSAMTFNISTIWNGRPIDHDPAIISLDRDRCNNVIMTVDAPFFNDPANPGSTLGQPLPGLLNIKQQLPLTYTATINNDRWTGEATIPSSYFPPKVTKFNAYAIPGSGTNRTYESLYPVPTGKYTDPEQQLPLTYTATIKNDRWTGKATIPGNYFPPKVTQFNAYAIHGSGTNRTYESLYPVHGGLLLIDPDLMV
ncbi:unnamed protein product [Mytilus coruscus]|uniref:Uncharacterized protein n=1 Tax=Mytilus coruscus TaxID=42192 RepID=A0A6J8BI45_MYTCO|nr:unnamed protein product [Mytilus coruscus]